MPKKEIIDLAEWAFMHGYGSIMLQSGELPTAERLSFIVDTIQEIKTRTKQKEIEAKGVTLDQFVPFTFELSH